MLRWYDKSRSRGSRGVWVFVLWPAFDSQRILAVSESAGDRCASERRLHEVQVRCAMPTFQPLVLSEVSAASALVGKGPQHATWLLRPNLNLNYRNPYSAGRWTAVSTGIGSSQGLGGAVSCAVCNKSALTWRQPLREPASYKQSWIPSC